MSEVLLRFETHLRMTDGRTFTARACGRPIEGGRRWEGWIEFVEIVTGEAVRTGQETVQPNEETLKYWATGLSPAYLEGALERALEPPVRPAPAIQEKPAFSGPAPRTAAPPQQPQPIRAVLNPFEVRLQGEEVLRDELVALDTMHLRNIALAYGLADETTVRDESLSRGDLAALIVSAVAERTQQAGSARD